MKNYIALVAVSIESLKNVKYHTFSKKHYVFLLFVVNVKMMMKRCLKKKNQLKL